MIAYHGKSAEKIAILNQLQAHAKADEIVKGQYWEDGKGCAVGCTIYSGRHAEYEPKFGIPVMLANLEDTIFEGLPNEAAKQWPIDFMSAIVPGADLSRVGWQFLHWLLTDKGVNPGIDHPLVRDAVRRCADVMALRAKGEDVPQDAAWSAESAASAARSAARSAESAAWSAASAARSAASAARSAESAAWSAAWSAADAARSAADAADAAFVLMAAKLLELLRAAPIPGGG